MADKLLDFGEYDFGPFVSEKDESEELDKLDIEF